MGPPDADPFPRTIDQGAEGSVEDAGSSGAGAAETTTGGLEPNLIDLIGRGLLSRHFGAVYDRPAIIDPRVDAIEPEPVVDLRTPITRPSRMLRAQWRAFTTYWRGDLLSMIGDHFTLVALPLATVRLTHSAFDVGVIGAVEAFATVAFGTMAGTFADRRRARPLMICCDLIRAAVLAMLVVLDLTHHSAFAALVVAALALGALRLFSDGGRSTLVADLVPDELDVRSNNRLVLSENIGATIGPALAGWAIAGGLWHAFGIDGLSFLCSAVAIALVGRIIRRNHLVEHTPTAPDSADRASYLEESRRAIRLILDDVVFRRALVVVTLYNIVTLPLGVMFVSLAVRTLHLPSWEIGLTYAVGGVGGIAAAPLVERDDRIRPGILPIGTGITGAVILLAGAVPSTATAMVAFVVGGAAFTFVLTQWAAFRQRRFPVDQQGRITLTSRRVMFAALLVGPLLGGWLSDVVDPAALWLACGATGLATAVWGLAVGLQRERVD